MSIKVSSADTHFSRCIRLAAEWTCERCGAAGNSPHTSGGVKLECCHIFGRRDAATRWDALNALAMCHTCHRHTTENPADFIRWIEDQWPGRIEILREKRRAIVKNTQKTRAEVAKFYLEEYKRMERSGKRNLVSWI